MGILHDLVYVVKIGSWAYQEHRNLSDAERLVIRLSGVVSKVRIEPERRERE